MAEKVAERDYSKLVEDKKTERNLLNQRMDADRDLVNLAKYSLLDVNNKKIPNSISVTLNDIGVFAVNVEASLGAAAEQVVVETDDQNLDTSYIEDFVKASFASANARLRKQARFHLNPFFDQQMCRRGGGAARCLFRLDKKTNTLITDIVPWDRRYFYSGMGPDGIDWGAYETSRSKDAILAEYPGVTVSGDSGIVLDIWDKEKNLVLIDGKKQKERANTYGYPPICQQMVPAGSMLADKSSMAYQGESIFFLIRDLVPELNRLVSIIQTLNQKALDNAMLWKSEAGTEATPPKHEDLTTPGSVTAADVGGGAEPVNYGDIRRSAYLLHSMIENRIQRGGLSSIDLGNLQFQLSAVALIEIGEGRDQVFLPRLGSRGLLNQQIAEMIIDQVIQTGATSVEIGTRGHKRTFDTKKLLGEYEIAFKYFLKSPKIDAARFTMAASVGNLISDKAKRRDILQREDPEEDERWLRWEEAEILSPAIKMNRTILGLLDMAERGDKHAEFEAELLSAEMGVNLQQMVSGEIQQPPPKDGVAKPAPMMPLFGGGGGSPKRTSDKQAAVIPEEGVED